MWSFFTIGSFGDQPFSPSLTDEAGEPGATDGGFAGGTLQPRFTATVSTTGDDTFNDCRDSGPPCATVQHGVDVACDGDTVSVAAGTYVEQVDIGKSVHVVGAGKASTTIKAPGVLASPANVVTIQGLGVDTEVTGVTVSGPGP